MSTCDFRLFLTDTIISMAMVHFHSNEWLLLLSVLNLGRLRVSSHLEELVEVFLLWLLVFPGRGPHLGRRELLIYLDWLGCDPRLAVVLPFLTSSQVRLFEGVKLDVLAGIDIPAGGIVSEGGPQQIEGLRRVSAVGAKWTLLRFFTLVLLRRLP